MHKTPDHDMEFEGDNPLSKTPDHDEEFSDPLGVSTVGVDMPEKQSVHEFMTDPRNVGMDFTLGAGEYRSIIDMLEGYEKGDATQTALGALGAIPALGMTVRGGRRLGDIVSEFLGRGESLKDTIQTLKNKILKPEQSPSPPAEEPDILQQLVDSFTFDDVPKDTDLIKTPSGDLIPRREAMEKFSSDAALDMPVETGVKQADNKYPTLESLPRQDDLEALTELNDLVDRGEKLGGFEFDTRAASQWRIRYGERSIVEGTKELLGGVDISEFARLGSSFGKNKVKVSVHGPQYIEWKISLPNENGLPDGVGYARRFLTIDPEDGARVAKHSLMTIHDKGKGVMKQLFKDSLELYDKIGVQRIETFANITWGGYVWAKVFRPLDPVKAVQEPLDRLDKLLQSGVLPASTIKRARDIIDIAPPEQMLRVLSDLRIPVDRKTLDQNVGVNFFGTEDADQFFIDIGDVDSIPLGKVLLWGHDWEGVIDLTDAAQRANLERYIGKK